MKVTVTEDIPANPNHNAIAAGEWTAEPGKWDAPGRQARTEHGMVLKRHVPGYGWFIVNVPQGYWDKYVKDGKIIIQQEEDAMSNNLPAITENAVAAVTPQEQINQASDMARLLKEVVSKAGLARKLGGRKEHLEYEAWATIARWFHCTPSTEWTRPIKDGEKIIGWEARVNILDETGRVIGSSEGMCMSDEANWRGKPSYALRSMAQTRTAGKALRSLFAHIAVLAGYSPTPAEEMDGITIDPKPEPKPAPPAEAAHSDEATDNQKRSLYAKASAMFGGREAALKFIAWGKDQAGAEYWTKAMLSGFLDDFDGQAKMYMAQMQTKAA